MPDRFCMCRALLRPLASPLPVIHSRRVVSCRGVMMGHQLRLYLRRLGELRFQEPGNLVVIVLPGAFE